MPKMQKECNEVLAMLDLIPNYDYLKIPANIINKLKSNCVEGYVVNIDSIHNAKISRKSYVMFVKLYQNYIATEEENKKIDEMLELNDKIKKEKYEVDFNKNKKKSNVVCNDDSKIFDSKHLSIEGFENDEVQQSSEHKHNQLIVVEKKSFFARIVERIRKMFGMK